MKKEWREYNRLSKSDLSDLKPLNELSGSEWAQRSKSVNLYNGSIALKRKTHGAAYPLTLVKHFIEIFTAKGDVVLDPFLGVGTTLDAARLLGRNGVGFEINKNFVNLAKKGVDPVDFVHGNPESRTTQKIVPDDCLNVKKHLKANSVDLIVTSPPYSNLLNITLSEFGGTDYGKNIYRSSKRKLADPYSRQVQDFGNLSWEEYCDRTFQLMRNLHDVAKPGSYNVWVVRDFRDMPKGRPYIDLHSKIIELGKKAEWILTDVVIWDQTNQRHLVKLGGTKTRRFYFNIGHSYIVVFRKNIPGERFSNA